MFGKKQGKNHGKGEVSRHRTLPAHLRHRPVPAHHAFPVGRHDSQLASTTDPAQPLPAFPISCFLGLKVKLFCCSEAAIHLPCRGGKPYSLGGPERSLGERELARLLTFRETEERAVQRICLAEECLGGNLPRLVRRLSGRTNHATSSCGRTAPRGLRAGPGLLQPLQAKHRRLWVLSSALCLALRPTTTNLVPVRPPCNACVNP